MSDEVKKPEKGSMSIREAARLGGRKTAETCLVRPWMEAARSKAGRATAAVLTHDERWDRASAGGAAVVERRGSEHMREIAEVGKERAVEVAKARKGQKRGPNRFQELAAQAAEMTADKEEEKC